jgi:hypothetical protein
MTNLIDKYNRNRPFLMITRLAHVAKGVRTEIRGWDKKSENTRIEENHRIIDRVNDTHMRDAVVIIDVVKNVCVKNAMTDSPDNEVISYFLQKYKEDVSKSLNSWATLKAQEKAKQIPEPSIDGVYGV